MAQVHEFVKCVYIASDTLIMSVASSVYARHMLYYILVYHSARGLRLLRQGALRYVYKPGMFPDD